MKTHKLYQVFTPSQPASLNYIERQRVNQTFTRALDTPGKQLIVYGHSGSGKTTLINKKLETNNLKSITTRCMKGMLFRDLIVEAFNKLEVFFEQSKENSKGSKISGGIIANYLALKATINSEINSSSHFRSKRAVDLPITPQTLAEYLGNINACWVIEDFHKMEPNEKTKLSQAMKIFMDLSKDYHRLKIIAVGAVNTAREVVQYDAEMKDRIAEIYVPLMTDDELQEIVIKGNQLLNFNFSKDVTEKISLYSSGLASVTHQISLLICENEEIFETCKPDRKADDKSFDVAIDEYVHENSDSLKHIYDQATKCKYKRNYDNPEVILTAILQNKKDEQTIREIADSIKRKNKDYKDNNLRKYVNELTMTERGEILRYNSDADTYSFSNPFIKVFSICSLNKNDNSSIITKAQIIEELKSTMAQELIDARKQFYLDSLGIEDDPDLDDED